MHQWIVKRSIPRFFGGSKLSHSFRCRSSAWEDLGDVFGPKKNKSGKPGKLVLLNRGLYILGVKIDPDGMVDT